MINHCNDVALTNHVFNHAAANDLRRDGIKYKANAPLCSKSIIALPNLRAFGPGYHSLHQHRKALISFGSTDKVEFVEMSENKLEFIIRIATGIISWTRRRTTPSPSGKLIGDAKDILVENLFRAVLTLRQSGGGRTYRVG